MAAVNLSAGADCRIPPLGGDQTDDYSRPEDPNRGRPGRRNKYWPPVGRVANAYGDRNMMCSCVSLAAYAVDSAAASQTPAKVAEGMTPEHGKYVANLCIGCHGDGLSGGKIPGGPPRWPAASNLTPSQGTLLTVYDSADKMKEMFRSANAPTQRGGRDALRHAA